MKNRHNIQAVLDEDLSDLLRSLGELAAVQAGERFCKICKTLITLRNLQMIIPLEEGGFEFVCDKPECIEAYGQSKELENDRGN